MTGHGLRTGHPATAYSCARRRGPRGSTARRKDRRRPYRITGRRLGPIETNDCQRRDEGRDDGLRVLERSAERGKLFIDLALRCYPKWWTERYGEEMLAVIDDLKLDGHQKGDCSCLLRDG